MKNLLLAAALGLAVGWLCSLAIRRAAPPGTPDAGKNHPAIDPRSQISAPPAARAISALTLNQQRAEARAGRPFNPYRDRIFSRDLFDSLGVEGLIEALRAGQISERTEIADAFDRIAQLDPLRALDLLRLVPGIEDHKSAERAIFSAWAKNDADGLLAYTKALPDTEQKADIAYGLALNWIRDDPATAMQHLAELREMAGVFKDRITDEMLASWAAGDLEGAEKWVENDSDPAQRDALRDALLAGHLRTLQGSAAVDFVRSRPDNPVLQRKLTEAYQNWAMGEPAAALDHFVSNPKGHAIWKEIEQMGTATMMNLLLFQKGDVGDILTLKEKIPAGEARRQFLLGAANTASSNDLEAAKLIIAEIPESRERQDAVGMFTELYMRKDPVGLSEWLTDLEASPSRDRAVSRFATLLIKSDPERARTWAETIGDERTRQRVLEQLTGQ